ncbi:MAG TPA: MerR family transcriptional regulator [Nocardioidaceae bacterium]|nr:MerR family transcriptional regulator [Nocardioidaceae bacterium]
MTAEPLRDDEDLISLDELTERVGISVRNIRFYTTRGLLPPPIKRGRSGYYSPDHIARLELVKELQAHGFTLSAIERYVARIPDESSPEEIAVHRVTLQPWLVEEPRLVTRRELDRLAGRRLSDDELGKLIAMEVVSKDGDKYAVVESRLSTGLNLFSLEVPIDVLQACHEIYSRHGRAIAEELTEVFQTMLWPRYKHGDIPAEHMVKMLESFQPASVAAIVEAFSQAMTDVRRGHAARRTT